jgi:hypothetical protein
VGLFTDRLFRRLIKKALLQGAREWTSGGVLSQYVDASSSERNAANAAFSSACL